LQVESQEAVPITPVRQHKAPRREHRSLARGHIEGVLEPDGVASGQLLLLSEGRRPEDPAQNAEKREQFHRAQAVDGVAGARSSKAHA
jgi:hypothetical protein